MKQLTKAAIKKPVTVIVLLVGLVLFSVFSISGMALQLMPDINIPMLVVMATYPGASPEEVDSNVMEKLREACANVSGLKKAQTTSNESYGVLVLQFNYGIKIADAHDDISAKIETVLNDLPDDVGKPTIMELDMNSFDDMTLSVSTEARGLDLLNIVNEELEPQLRRAGALADLTVTGGNEKYISVRLIPEYARQYGISANSIVSAITSVNYSIPAGSVTYGNQSLNMETEVRYDDIERLRQIPITTSTGQTIHLYDVCDIDYGTSDATSLSRYDGNDNISIGLKRKQSSTSVILSRQIQGIIEDFRTSNPEVSIKIIRDSADEIRDTLRSVVKTLVQGVLLAMLVIFIFFGDLKGSLIVGSTMPVSLLFAVVCMYFAGISLNLVSMNALVLSIGMITDNAVVVIELCFRKKEAGLEYADAAYEGTSVVIGSVIGSTITTVVVYLPLALLEGMSGQYFKQLGYTIVFVLLASLFCATTLVPFFYSVYKPVERKNNPVTKLIERIAKVYGRVLERILNKSVLVVLTAVVLFALSIYLASGMRSELLAAVDEGIMQINLKFRPNLSLETMDTTVMELESFVRESGVVDDYSITVQEASSSASVTAYKMDDIELTTQQIVDDWNEKLRNYSTICEITVSAGSSTGLGSMNSGGTEEIDIAADDLESLREGSRMITDILEDTKGVLSVNSSVEETGSKIMIDIDPELARVKGFAPAQLSQMVYMNMNGADAGEVTIEHNKYDIKVEYPKDYFSSLDEVRAMTFTSPSGAEVLLSEIADIRFTEASQSITRSDGRYSASINAIMTVETKDEIMDRVHERFDTLTLPEGVNFIENAITETMTEEFAAIGQAIVIAFYLVFMVMAIQFESIAYSILIMLSIPFAAIGSILLMRILDVKVSMTVLLGVLMLAGIVVNNGIIYIDTTNQFRDGGLEIKKALVTAGKDRLRPILITTITTELSMIPVAFKLAKNSESLQGMAVVIVGGLFASTLLTLLLIPNFYLMFEVFHKKRDKERKKRKERYKAAKDTADASDGDVNKDGGIPEIADKNSAAADGTLDIKSLDDSEPEDGKDGTAEDKKDGKKDDNTEEITDK